MIKEKSGCNLELFFYFNSDIDTLSKIIIIPGMSILLFSVRHKSSIFVNFAFLFRLNLIKLITNQYYHCYYYRIILLRNNQMDKDQDKILDEVTSGEYKYGFYSDIESEQIQKGLSEDVVRIISSKKKEPEWLLEFRLKAYRHWLTMKMPAWPNLKIPEINYQDIIFYSAPKQKPKLNSLDEVDPELKRTFDKLGIPLEEQKHLAGVAVDAVMDSVSVKTTFRETLAEVGIIFCSFSDAVQEYPDLVKRYMGTVVPYTDNFFAALNSAVFSDGSFCYIPKGVRCPMELSTYFRINAANTGQFERTLLVADEESYVSYLEGLYGTFA